MAGSSERVSTDTNEQQLNLESTAPAVSGDGRYVVFNGYDNAASSGSTQVYLKDRQSGALTLVSQAGGTPANFGAQEGTISINGSTIAFQSGANNLGFTSAHQQVYVQNVAKGALTLVSSTAGGVGGDSTSENPSLSTDGRFIAFDSLADDIDPADYNYGRYQVYVKDLSTGTIQIASSPVTGSQGNGVSSVPLLSGNGNVVAFTTTFPQNNGFPTNGQNVSREAYVTNLTTHALTLVSTNSDGSLISSSAGATSISGDGNLVVFTALTSLGSEVYVKNIATGATTLVSADAAGNAANSVSTSGTISADGRYVLFQSVATDLGPTADGQSYRSYIKDLSPGAVTLVHDDPAHADNTGANPISLGQAFSGSDRVVVFGSAAVLSNDDTNGKSDVYANIPAAPTVALTTPSAVVNNPNQVVSGTVDAADAGTTVGIYDIESFAQVGSGVVNPDGTFNAAVTLTHQGDNVLRAIDANEGGTGSSAAIALTLDSIAPAVTITTPTQTTSAAALTVAGTAEVGTGTVSVYDYNNGAPTLLGTAPVGNDGTWSADVTLLQGSNALVATDTDSAGNTGVSAPVTFTFNPPTSTGTGTAGTGTGTGTTSTDTGTGTGTSAGDTVAPAVAFDAVARPASATIVTLSGTASDDVGVAKVELFAGQTDLGAATLNADGTWSLTHDFGAGSFGAGTASPLLAVATDAAGNAAAAPSPYDLITGITGMPYVSEQDTYAADGASGTQLFFGGQGGLVYVGQYAGVPGGAQTFTYSGGRYFNNKPYSSYTDTYTADGTFQTEVLNNKDGSHQVTGFADDLVLHSIAYDTMTGGGQRETFSFTPGFGADVITDFQAAGRGHDTLDLSGTRFTNAGQVLARTFEDRDGNAVIGLNPNNSITLQGVSQADLAAHRNDFTFHA